MILVTVTSVVIKWFVEEPLRDAARQILKSEHELVAPDFMIAEVANVLWRRQRSGDVEASQVNDALVDLPRFFARLAPASDLVLQALDMARELAHSVYDCIFLAMAAQLTDAKLVTADERFLAKASNTQYGRLLWPLHDFSLSREP